MHDGPPLHEPSAPEPWVRSRALGVSGTLHSGGRVYREWDRLDWREWVQRAAEMLLQPDVSRAVSARISGMTRARWTVRPAIEGDPQAERLAELVRLCLGLDGTPGLLQTPWESVITEGARYIHFGAYLQEVVWAYSHRHAIWHPVAIEGREPQSIDSWGHGEELGPITQRRSGWYAKPPEPMPGEKVLLYTRGRTGTDWTGLGLGRAALLAYDQLSALEAALVSGTIRSGVLPPSVLAGSPQSVANTGIDAATAVRMVRDLRDAAARSQSGERVVFVEMEGVASLRWQPDGFDPARAKTLLEYLRMQIATAYGVEYLLLGQTQSGSRSVGEVHASEVRGLNIEDLEVMAGTINGPWRAGGGLVGAICELNLPNVDLGKLPVVWHTGLEPEALAESLGALPGLVQSGIVTATDDLEGAVRGVLDVPPLGESLSRTPAERAASGAPLLAALARRRGL